ncbi:MAG: hypothetical protein ACJ8BW_18265 [Ktedonobacteraceae bacterium]
MPQGSPNKRQRREARATAKGMPWPSSEGSDEKPGQPQRARVPMQARATARDQGNAARDQGDRLTITSYYG